VFLFIVALDFCSFAQSSEFISSIKKKHKTRIDELLADKPIYINGSSPNLIASKAIRNFTRDFKEAIDVRWFLTDEGGYIVKFIYKGVACRGDYDYKGRCLVTARYYNEDKLPREVRHLVKTNYYDFSIYRIAELSLSNKIVYIVTLENDESWMKISLIDGEFALLENYKKA
jgi:hypothetical protein